MPICKNCSNEFVARSGASWCSDACRKAAKRKPDTQGAKSDTVSGIAKSDTANPDTLQAEANKLVRKQREHRGWTVNKAGEKILGPYVATAETEERAREILDLRRRAARAEFPTRQLQET